MISRFSSRRIGAGLAAAVATATLVGDGTAARVNPRKAAAALVARLKAEATRAHVATLAASPVVSRDGRLWLAVGSSTTPTSSTERTRVRVYGWSGAVWKLRGTVTGDDLSPSQWIKAASLTGSRDPDFAIQGCGAGDTNCLSVVSDVGGHWHAVPFVYGYGKAMQVNGLPAGHLVETEVNACGCAGGPSTFMYERYHAGAFVPAEPPGRPPDCRPSSLAAVADGWQVQVLRFERAACADGWALAVGTGAGFSGPVVGLFVRGYNPAQWQVLTLDNGLALPTAPAIYDLPLPLLARLAGKLGPRLAPEIAAARLIAGFESQSHFRWPLQNGIVNAGGADWLIAILPAGPAPNDYSPYPVGAVVYRWNGSSWTIKGRVPHLPAGLNVDWFGGWFVGSPRNGSATVAFTLAGSDSHSKRIITNAGGTWHVV